MVMTRDMHEKLCGYLNPVCFGVDMTERSEYTMSEELQEMRAELEGAAAVMGYEVLWVGLGPAQSALISDPETGQTIGMDELMGEECVGAYRQAASDAMHGYVAHGAKPPSGRFSYDEEALEARRDCVDNYKSGVIRLPGVKKPHSVKAVLRGVLDVDLINLGVAGAGELEQE